MVACVVARDAPDQAALEAPLGLDRRGGRRDGEDGGDGESGSELDGGPSKARVTEPR
jgi:hypothetical protein